MGGPKRIITPPALSVPVPSLASTALVLPKPTYQPPDPTKKSHARRQALGHVPRPRNAFILFRCDCVRQRLIPPSVEDHHSQISKTVANLWNNMTEAQRQPWVEMAEKEKEEHNLRNPGYRYSPASLKKRPKRDPSEASPQPYAAWDARIDHYLRFRRSSSCPPDISLFGSQELGPLSRINSASAPSSAPGSALPSASTSQRHVLPAVSLRPHAVVDLVDASEDCMPYRGTTKKHWKAKEKTINIYDLPERHMAERTHRFDPFPNSGQSTEFTDPFILPPFGELLHSLDEPCGITLNPEAEMYARHGHSVFDLPRGGPPIPFLPNINEKQTNFLARNPIPRLRERGGNSLTTLSRLSISDITDGAYYGLRDADANK